MFTWNAAKVLAAIDAGIAEVIALFNAQYEFSVRKLSGPEPIRAMPIAMALTVAALNADERRIAQIDKALTALLTPQQNTCDKCGGDGVYKWGAFVNGKPTKTGDCFQCARKGYVTYDDIRRVRVYWDLNALSHSG